MQKEEFQHTAYATNAYVTVGPLAKLVLQGEYPSLSRYANMQQLNHQDDSLQIAGAKAKLSTPVISMRNKL